MTNRVPLVACPPGVFRGERRRLKARDHAKTLVTREARHGASKSGAKGSLSPSLLVTRPSQNVEPGKTGKIFLDFFVDSDRPPVLEDPYRA